MLKKYHVRARKHSAFGQDVYERRFDGDPGLIGFPIRVQSRRPDL
jgi:hypothetical protein